MTSKCIHIPVNRPYIKMPTNSNKQNIQAIKFNKIPIKFKKTVFPKKLAEIKLETKFQTKKHDI